MSIFSKLHEVLIGIHVFTQPKRKMWPSAASNNAGQSNLRAEDGYAPESRIRSGNYLKFFGFLFTLVVVSAASAQSGGSIAGSVKDPTGAVIPGSQVVLLNPATGARQTTVTDGSGNFDFPVAPVGQYELDVTANGFNPYRQTDLAVHVKSSLVVNLVLQLAQTNQTVTVTNNTAAVQTSDTQIGQTIEGKQVTSLPLNGRSYTDLLAVQAGVVPVTTSGSTSTTNGGGFGTVPAGGEQNTGQSSVNGQRESDNAYYLNGVSVQETVGQQAGIIPDLDSIAEFRILSSNVDAGYGGFTGGIVDVETQSGTKQFHGNLFEFFRNTHLDASNYFSPERAAFHQNQYGGTFGGPLKKDKIFFFADYQGQRYVQGIETGITAVPSLSDRAGNLSDTPTFAGMVDVPYQAQILSSRLGEQVTAGEPFSQVFPGNVIPQRAWGPTASPMMQYIPTPNTGTNEYSSGAYNYTIDDNKTSGRLDFNSARFGNSSIYYFNDWYTLDNPYPGGLGGATLPGNNGLVYDATSSGMDQVVALDNVHPFGTKTVNEIRYGYTRLNNAIGEPRGGVGVTLAQQGIQSGGEGIVQGDPSQAGVEPMYFNGFSVGTNPFSLQQVNSDYDLYEAVTRTIGNHTIKAGGRFTWFRVIQSMNLYANGTFSFFASGQQTTGNDFADFLLGFPDAYSQESSPPFHERADDGGLFVEDSYRVRPNVTLNYGLRWDYVTPWAEKNNQISTLILGVQSATFPGAPLGYLLPGDPLPGGGHVPAGIAPTRWTTFRRALALPIHRQPRTDS